MERNNSIEKIKQRRLPEFAALILFATAYIVVSIYHEPWFDEAQAWQIAKCASIKEILFEIPHYEGHPPLWHLILAIPAKFGVPYEIGLKSVGFIISMAYAYLIIFKSPFPLIARLAIPFNYFLFYQYGVIVRPYGMLLLFLLFLAIVFPYRHIKPFKFVAMLALICLTHSYGIMLACGISMCYLWEIFKEKGFKKLICEIFRDKRTLALSVLLIVAIIIVIEILPDEKTFVASAGGKNPFIICFLCTLFTLLPECLCTSMNWSIFDTYLLQAMDISISNLVVAVIVGVFIWVAIFCISSKNSFKYFALPNLLFALFGAAVYFTAHHAGVAFEILLFWLWITLSDEDRFAGWKKFSVKTDIYKSKMAMKGFACIGVVFLIIPIYWTISASVHDIQSNYSHGKGTAEFLKRTDLDNALIFTSWINPENDDRNAKIFFCNADPSLLAYFNYNILANTNGGDKEKAYTVHTYTTREEIEQKFEDWRKIGTPDVMIGYTNMSYAYGDEISIFDYSPVFLSFYNQIYKNNINEKIIPILLRNDLLDKYDVQVQDITNYQTGYHLITSEMIEAYRNGEATIDDLVDMTLGSYGK